METLKNFTSFLIISAKRACSDFFLQKRRSIEAGIFLFVFLIETGENFTYVVFRSNAHLARATQNTWLPESCAIGGGNRRGWVAGYPEGPISIDGQCTMDTLTPVRLTYGTCYIHVMWPSQASSGIIIRAEKDI